MRASTDGNFNTWDGTPLFYRTWAPKSATSDRALIVIHRGHEHSGRLQNIVDGLGLDDFWAFAFDARGHGRSPGPRGYADDFSFLVQDLDFFVRMISERYDIPIENISVVANSVGAVVATTWVHDYAPRIRSMVLAAPAFRVKLYVPFALAGLRVLNLIKKPAFISSYVKSRMLTHDKVEAEAYNQDPLITRDIAVNILIGLFDAATRVIKNAGNIVTPTLVLSAGKDFVVQLSAQQKFFAGLGGHVKKMHVFKDFYHGVLYETDKKTPMKMARDFILESFVLKQDTAYLIHADQKGASYREYQRLLKSPGLIKDLWFFSQKLSLRFFGWMSQGMRIGMSTGFDSGLSLDYVYENKPRGFTFIGRLMDWSYLQAVGWRGIRLRRQHMQAKLEECIQHLHQLKQPIRILDIAGGPGRYMLDVLKNHRDKKLNALICDNTHANLEKGRAIAKELKIDNVQYVQTDSFAQNPAWLSFKPNIIVISGFFELFSSNAHLLQTLRNLASCADAGATILYTGQAWHPQLEMIARVLNNREGKDWIMRLRSQAELDELFRHVGFEKRNMQIDPYGIFTVSEARFVPETPRTVVAAHVPRNSQPELTH